MRSLIKKSCNQLELEEDEYDDYDEKISKKLRQMSDIIQIPVGKSMFTVQRKSANEKTEAAASRKRKRVILTDVVGSWTVSENSTQQDSIDNEDSKCNVEPTDTFQEEEEGDPEMGIVQKLETKNIQNDEGCPVKKKLRFSVDENVDENGGENVSDAKIAAKNRENESSFPIDLEEGEKVEENEEEVDICAEGATSPDILVEENDGSENGENEISTPAQVKNDKPVEKIEHVIENCAEEAATSDIVVEENDGTENGESEILSPVKVGEVEKVKEIEEEVEICVEAASPDMLVDENDTIENRENEISSPAQMEIDEAAEKIENYAEEATTPDVLVEENSITEGRENKISSPAQVEKAEHLARNEEYAEEENYEIMIQEEDAVEANVTRNSPKKFSTPSEDDVSSPTQMTDKNEAKIRKTKNENRVSFDLKHTYVTYEVDSDVCPDKNNQNKATNAPSAIAVPLNIVKDRSKLLKPGKCYTVVDFRSKNDTTDQSFDVIPKDELDCQATKNEDLDNRDTKCKELDSQENRNKEPDVVVSTLLHRALKN